MWEVYKFGGTSITKDGFDLIKSIIKNKGEKKIVIVLSAISTVTDTLVDLTENYSEKLFNVVTSKYSSLGRSLNLNTESMAVLNNHFDKLKSLFLNSNDNNLKIGYGEILSTVLLNLYINITLLYSRSIVKKNGDRFLCDLNIFLDYTGDNQSIVMQGFIGSDSNGETVLLSRGGSDTTATLIANTLSSKKVYIYTDVDGLLSADPRFIKNTKLISNIHYDIAQELAASGAKVLHPYSLLPAKEKNIDIIIKNTYNSDSNGTTINNNNNNNNIAVTNEAGVTIFHIKSVNMWNNYGFVYDIFKDFKENNIDVNIITTSQFVISCTTQCAEKIQLKKLKKKLEKKYEVEMIMDSNNISVVGSNISLDTFFIDKLFQITKNYKIHITHFSSNNLSISFIVEKNIHLSLMNDIHDIVVHNYDKWWKIYTNYFITTMQNNNKNSMYFYNLATVIHKCRSLKQMKNVDNLYYAMKANSNKYVLEEIVKQGIGLECVSVEEMHLALNYTDDILFTPNFCNISEYKEAFDMGLTVIVDNVEILSHSIFKNKYYGLRIDINNGSGHHKKVITAGDNSKFGINISDIDKIDNKIDKENILGLHCHSGSGIEDINIWNKNLKILLELAGNFPNLEWIDLGGGLGIDIDPLEIDKTLDIDRKELKLFMEPGRYFVSTAGVLVSNVTQIKRKNEINYLGINTGMNSLIRPALYNAYHDIHNISASYNRDKKKIYNSGSNM